MGEAGDGFFVPAMKREAVPIPLTNPPADRMLVIIPLSERLSTNRHVDRASNSTVSPRRRRFSSRSSAGEFRREGQLFHEDERLAVMSWEWRENFEIRLGREVKSATTWSLRTQ